MAVTQTGPVTNISRQKQVDLASAVGAGILGMGLGVVAAAPLARYATLLIGLGIVLHGWGMLARRRLESSVAMPIWSIGLYWGCWIALAGLVFWLLLSIQD
jgi:hypothetical protein